MIFIVVKFPARPERSEKWLTDVADYTAAMRAEPGNIPLWSAAWLATTRSFTLAGPPVTAK